MFGPMIEFLADHIQQFQEKRKSVPADVFDVTMFSLEEIFSVFESMDILIQKNDYSGCIKLARSVLENSINIQYIYKDDSESRAKNFKLKSLEGMVKKFKTLNTNTPEVIEMHDFFQEKLKEYSPEKKIREKFRELNMDATYSRSYVRLSDHVHPTYRSHRLDYAESGPYVEELKRTVRADTCLITLMALEKICTKYDLDGGVMVIDDLGYKGTVLFATNPKKIETETNA
mgnify:FL=1